MKLIESKLLTRNKTVILENLKLAKQYVDQGKLSQDDLRTLTLLDPTPTKKYMGWIAKVWINEKPDIDDLGGTIEEYNTLNDRGKTRTKDINQFKSFKDLEKEVTDINNSGENISTKDLESDYDTVINNSDLLIMSPHTHEASRKLGLSHFSYRNCGNETDSAWCTTYKAPDHFNDYYYSNNVTFYYIKIKSQSLIEKLKTAFPSKWEHLQVVALAVLPNGKLDGYDGLDNQIKKGEIATFTKIIGIS